MHAVLVRRQDTSRRGLKNVIHARSRMKNLFILIALVVTFASAPMQSQAEDKRVDSLRLRLGATVIVFLAKPLDPKSHIIDLQNYVRDGIDYIPVFTSNARLKDSLKGAKPPAPVIEIDRRLFFSMLSGKETIIFDVSLPDELQFPASALKSYFSSDIEAWREEEKKLPHG